MNILKNLTSQIGKLQTIVPRFLSIEPRLYSVSAENAISHNTNIIPLENEPEPDKLYKKLELEIRGHDPAVMKSYVWYLTQAASHLGIEVGKSWPLRKSHKLRHTLLKSVHVHKKHRVQYEIRTYFHFVHLHRLTGSTCDTYLEYIERNLPEGVGMKVTKIEMQRLPEYMLAPPTSEETSN